MAYSLGPKIVTNGLVAAYDPSNPVSWPGSGTTLFDLGPNGYNMTLGSTFITGSGVTTALTQNATIIDTEIPYMPIGDTWTVGVWFQLRTPAARITLVDEGTGLDSMDLSLTGTGPINFTINGPRGTEVTAAGSISTVGINYAVASYRTSTGANNLHAWYNGVLTLDSGQVDTLETLGNFRFLVDVVNDNCRLLYIHIYNRKLTDSEVLQNYNELKDRFEM